MNRGSGPDHVPRLLGIAVVLCGLAAATGCTPAAQATLSVTPAASRGDEAVAITVTGLPKNAATDLEVTSTDAAGASWASHASFTADANGVVDVSTAASTGGTYLGVWPMGLIDSMQTADAASHPLLAYRAPVSGSSEFQVTAQAGGLRRTASFTRTFLPEPVVSQTLTLQNEHVSGVYEAPAQATSSRPAVLIIGGSEGGNSGVLLAQSLAARGIPALSVAYFSAPGLPEHLADIPLEYFVTALTWLGRQPGVDRNRVWVSGASYGSEAALLLGARHPGLVHGVVTLSGGNTVTCSLTPGATLANCTRPPFTSGGTPVPFTRQFDNPAPTDQPAAVIPVEKIDGPVVALCGGSDLEWHSCQLSQAVLDRRHGHGTGAKDVLLSYPDAGHYVDFLIPNRPINPAADTNGNGATPRANPDADADAWPKIIARLAGG